LAAGGGSKLPPAARGCGAGGAASGEEGFRRLPRLAAEQLFLRTNSGGKVMDKN